MLTESTLPMTKAMEYIFDYLPQLLDGNAVCQAYRDKSKCSDCGFNLHKKEVLK
jgi:hypothetical protein